jgi:hypothetical protein
VTIGPRHLREGTGETKKNLRRTPPGVEGRESKRAAARPTLEARVREILNGGRR